MFDDGNGFTSTGKLADMPDAELETEVSNDLLKDDGKVIEFVMPSEVEEALNTMLTGCAEINDEAVFANLPFGTLKVSSAESGWSEELPTSELVITIQYDRGFSMHPSQEPVINEMLKIGECKINGDSQVSVNVPFQLNEKVTDFDFKMRVAQMVDAARTVLKKVQTS